MRLLSHQPLRTRDGTPVVVLQPNLDGWLDGLPWMVRTAPLSIADALGLGLRGGWHTVDAQGAVYPGEQDPLDLKFSHQPAQQGA